MVSICFEKRHLFLGVAGAEALIEDMDVGYK